MTACGPNDSTGESGALEQLTDDVSGSLQAAADKAKETESVRADVVTSGGAADSELQITMNFRGAVSFEMVGDMVGEDVTMRMVDSALYTVNSPEDRELYGGKHWTKIDLNASPAGDVGVDQMLQESDPSRQIEALLELEGVTAVGEETVDGIRTVQYTVTTTPEELAEAQPEGSAEDSDLSAAGDALGVTEVTLDVWIDEEYLLRRFRLDTGTAGVTTADYYDYNEPVQIEAPPAADVVDLEDLFTDLEGSFAEIEDAMKEIEDLTGGN